MPRVNRLHPVTAPVRSDASNEKRRTGYEPRPEAKDVRFGLEMKVIGAILGLALLAFVIYEATLLL